MVGESFGPKSSVKTRLTWLVNMDFGGMSEFKEKDVVL